MNKTTYTALTIGPIYKTLSLARKTRELWGGSYLFSYIMRRLIKELDISDKLCLPFHDNLLTAGMGNGTGLFPDRFIVEGDVGAKVENAQEIILNKIETISGLPLDYLQNYLCITSLTFTLPQKIINEDGKENIVFVANSLLDTVELNQKHYRGDINGINWRKAIDKLNGKLFYKEAFNKEEKDRFFFPSIIEIATDDFRQQNEEEYQKLVDDYIKGQEESDQNKFQLQLMRSENFGLVEFRSYHKYIAIVMADGDNIGKTIGELGKNVVDVKNFSAALFNFTLAAGKSIKEYGGKAVYIGGDDLLFFAPVAVHNGNEETPELISIFGLIEKIDKAFNDTVIENMHLKKLYAKEGALADKKPSMSYGVSMTYSKFPLNEARDSAEELLREAKKIKDDKDKICFKLHKHSGQGFGFTIDKKKTNAGKPESFDYFMKMVGNIPLQKDLLSSIIYKLGPLHKLLNAIAGKKDRLTAFFDQEFELGKLRESKDTGSLTPKEQSRLDFLDNVKDYFHQLNTEFPDDNKDLPQRETDMDDGNIAKLYSTLRFMKHLTDKDNE